jgi:hypothetical protein
LCAGADSIVEAQDYDEVTRTRTPSRDKVTGQKVWQVRVMDMDPELAGRTRETTVKVVNDYQPVPEVGGPFQAVEFEGMTVTPYVAQNGRMAYSLRATGFKAQQAAPSRKAA